MKRLLKTMWRHKIRTLLIGIPTGFFLLTAGAVVAEITLESNQPSVADQNLVNAQAACSLDSQAFLNTINQWRAGAGVPALTYSSDLESAAKSRVQDMQQYHYYGHVNPETKHDAGWYIKPFMPLATTYSWNEVLDGPNDAKQTLVNFQNSPEHYDALVSPTYHYMGFISVYQPERWAVYDNSGNLETRANTNSANCIVIAELASVIKSSTTPTQASATAIPDGCTKTTLYRSTTYQNASWLPKGTQQVSVRGSDGIKEVCNGKVVLNLQPMNDVVYVGTDDTPPLSYSTPPMQKYTYTSPTPSHADCLQSVAAQTGGQGDLDAICKSLGY